MVLIVKSLFEPIMISKTECPDEERILLQKSVKFEIYREEKNGYSPPESEAKIPVAGYYGSI